jgi:hypothetical protein
MSKLKSAVGLALSLLIAMPPGAFASSHREAPITALDHTADITDFYAFVSYDHPDRVTFILNVDPFLQPSNGPNYFPLRPIDRVSDQDRQQSGRAGRRHLPVPLPDQHPRCRASCWLRGRGQRDRRAGKLARARQARHADRAPAITSLTGAGAAGLSLQQTFTWR